MRESDITINGIELTSSQAMAVRCAVEHFCSHLAEHGLGEDNHGTTMTQLYLGRLGEVAEALYTRVGGVDGLDVRKRTIKPPAKQPTAKPGILSKRKVKRPAKQGKISAKMARDAVAKVCGKQEEKPDGN